MRSLHIQDVIVFLTLSLRCFFPPLASLAGGEGGGLRLLSLFNLAD